MAASQRVSANAIRALKDALSSVFWFKRDLYTYAKAAVNNEATFLAGIDWTDRDVTKRESVERFVDRLVELQDDHRDVLVNLMVDVAGIDDFSALEHTDDPEVKIPAAKAAVKRLAALVKPYEQMLLERQQTRERIAVTRQHASDRRATAAQLQRIRASFFELHSTTMSPQKRGYAFETLLRDLFGVYDLDPKASYKIDGEQIDGAFTLDNEHFLLEAKWEKRPVGRDEVDVFRSRLTRKADFARGLIIAVNGFADSAIEKHSQGGARFVLADGADLLAVLEQRVELTDLLRLKLRHAALTGEIMKRLG